MALDAELIERSNQRSEQADNSESNVPNSDYEEKSSASRVGSLRENVQASKNGMAPQSQGDIRVDKKIKSRTQDTKGAVSKGAEKALSPIKKGISSLLKSAWMNLIDSWGLTLVWIDIHVFGNQVMGNNIFCDLGEEWIPDDYVGAKDKAPKELDAPKKAIGLVENMGCCCLNLGCVLTIIMILSLFAMIAAALSNPLQVGWEIMKVVFQIIKSVFT